MDVVLPRLSLDSRARAACVCRAWREAAANPALWLELNFEGCTAQVNDKVLASLCKRAGASLNALHLVTT